MFSVKYVHWDHVFFFKYIMHKTQALYENLRLIILDDGREIIGRLCLWIELSSAFSLFIPEEKDYYVPALLSNGIRRTS